MDTPHLTPIRSFGLWMKSFHKFRLNPNVKLHIVGFNRLENSKLFAPYKDKLVFHGKVHDLKETLDQFRLMVVPTRFAAGIPQKTL